MSDTFITVVAIILAVVLVIVVPLVVTSQRVDNVSQLDVEALTSNFVDEMRATGKLTLDNYDKFLQNLTATGNTYDVSMEFKILDENPGKKSMQTTKDKIGENVYYSIYTTQIEEVLKSENTYNLKQGDMVSVTVRNTNLTLGQELKNFAYKIVGNDTYTISASNSGLIVGNGSTDVILANNVNEDTIGYTLRENDSNGTILNLNGEIKNKNGWTNQNVYVELYPINSTYNFDLLYYWRYANKTEDYITEYKNDGNNLVFEGEGKYQIQVYWKHSILEKYSNIKTMDIKIDRQKPTIGSVTSSNQKGNIGIISVKDVTDTGGSGLAASCYYYKWTDKDITTQPTAPTIDTDGWTINNTTTVDSDYNGKRCWVWVKDKAGNISEPKSADVENVVPKVIDFSLTNTIVKKGENLIIKPQNIATHPEGNIIDYKEISYVSSDSSVATVNSDGVATGLKGGTTEITCIIKNYNESTIEKTCILTVVDLSYSPNGGNFVLPYDNNTAGTATIKSTVTISGGNYAEYAWSTSNSSYPNAWTAYASKTGGTVSKTSTTASVYYLWTKVSDGYGNSVIYVSNAFSISANKIEIKPDKTSWTNGNIICSITYPDNTVSNTRKAAYGNSLSNAVTNSNSASPPTTSVTVSSNGYVYAQATDALGNKVTASLQITNIDKTAPSVPTIKYNSGSNECKWENNINITLSSSDNLTGIAYYEIDWNGDGNANTTTGENFIPWNNWSSCNTRFRAVDGVGNRSAWTSSIHVHMDTQAPTHTKWWFGQIDPYLVTLYIQATDNASGISRVTCPTSTYTGGYNNWVWIEAVWDAGANAYRADINPAIWGHFNTTYVTHLYIWDGAGNGGLINNTSYGMGNAVAYNYSTGRYYSSLASAISASSSAKVLMVSDTNETISIQSGYNITLDLNGKTLSSSGITLTNNGTLTLQGGTLQTTGWKALINNGTTNLISGTITSSGSGGWTVDNRGTFYMSGGTINDTATGAGAVVLNTGNFQMTSGTLLSGEHGLVSRGGNVDVYNGTIRVTGDYSALQCDDDGTMDINNSIISGKVAVQLWTNNSSGKHIRLFDCAISGSIINTQSTRSLVEIARTSTGYAVFYYDTFSSIGGIWFPTWTGNNGQDDLKWHGTLIGTRNASRVFYYYINKSEHNNETGTYFTDIYANGTAPGNYVDGFIYNVK